MSLSPDVIDTDEIAAHEARREQRARYSPWIVASRIVAHYRARLVPAIFVLLILTPGLMMLASRRDLSSAAQGQFDLVAMATLPTLIGRIGTLLILALSAMAVFGWLASERRGQGRRQHSHARRRDRQRGGRVGAVVDHASSPRVEDRRTNQRTNQRTNHKTRRRTAAERDAAIRARMLATSEAARWQRQGSAIGDELEAVGDLDAAGQAGAQGEREEAARSRRRLQSRRPARSIARLRSSGRVGLPVVTVLVAALVYQLTYAVLPQLTGLADHLSLTAFYFAVVVLALYASRRMPRRKVLNAIQWSLAVYLWAGLALAIVDPAAAVTSAGLEQRVSFVDSRFWGVGSNPNSVAPMAILLLMLQIRQRWQHGIFWLVGNGLAAVAAVVVLVWAQSQTAWAAAILILPWMLIRSRLDQHFSLTTLQPHHAVIGLLVIVIAAGILGAELISRDAVGRVADSMPGSSFWKGDALATASRVGDQFMTGRGVIWSLALDVWRDHPWLGFGSTAWDYDFRHAFSLPLATSAHNQLMQVLSVAGLIGTIPFVIYVVLLGYFSWRGSSASRGLTVGLFALLAVRMMTEVPLETRFILSSDVVQHLALLYCLFTYVLPGSDRHRAR